MSKQFFLLPHADLYSSDITTQIYIRGISKFTICTKKFEFKNVERRMVGKYEERKKNYWETEKIKGQKKRKL